eukprot:3713302-Rhodomonas_salina.1
MTTLGGSRRRALKLSRGKSPAESRGVLLCGVGGGLGGHVSCLRQHLEQLLDLWRIRAAIRQG